ncbi:hypothetical protein CRYUN_Cryun30bG0044400 [Craigia yunnanensis]
MPMYQPFSRREADMKLDIQVIDLETAAKDGILRGGCGVISTGFASEKLDLKIMIEELESMDVPTVFICPISLEPMQDPKYLAMKKRSEDVQGRVKENLKNLKKVKGQARVRALKELRQVIQAHGTAKKTVVEDGGLV